MPTPAGSLYHPTIKRQRLVKTFLQLAKISSPTGEEAAIRAVVQRRLRALGVKTRVDRAGNLFGYTPGRGRVPLLLGAHLDTVQPCRNIKPVVRGHIIMTDGRTILGADDKAGIAYILECLAVLKDQRQAHVPLEIVFTVSEEDFCGGAAQIDFSRLHAPFGIVIDGALVGGIDYLSPYIAEVNVTITGKAAHSGAEPEKGISAIQIAASAIHHMRLGRLDADTTANIGIMQAGMNRNAIPDRASLHGEVRSFSKRKLEDQLESMHKALEDAAEQYGGLLNIDSRVVLQGYRLSKTDPDLKKVQKLMRQVSLEPQLLKTGGASDANTFMSKGIKVLDIGTGVQRPHTVEERIDIYDMVKTAQLLYNLIVSY